MGELGDDFRAWKEYKKKVKARRAEHIPRLMEKVKRQYRVEQLSEYHYRVDGRCDWWPTTGAWRFIDGSRSGGNVGPMLNAIAKAREVE